jgi:hypothetical protein
MARKNIYSTHLNYPGHAVSRGDLPDAIHSVPNKPLVEIYPDRNSNFLFVQQNPGKINSLLISDMDGKNESIRLKKKKEMS